MKRKPKKNLRPNLKSENRQPELKVLEPSKPSGRPRFTGFLWMVIRWGLVIVIGTVIVGSVAANKKIDAEPERVQGELAVVEAEKEALTEEVHLFSDPEWREAYWKRQMYNHRPGEYYIEFVEPGAL